MSGCSDCTALMARRLPLSQGLFALLDFHLQPSEFALALPAPLPLSHCLTALLSCLCIRGYSTSQKLEFSSQTEVS